MTSLTPETPDSGLPTRDSDRLRINEIFVSIQGESRSAGWSTVFVRLTGCPLRCGYCDTTHAFHEGRWMTVADVVTEVARAGVPRVTVTGGEPLAQRPCDDLIRALCDAGHDVSVETSGAVDITRVDPRARVVMDIKTPGSGEVDRNLLANLAQLRATDEVKFVLCNRADYEWSREFVHREKLDARCEVLFSPVWEGLAPRDLAEWIIADRLPVRLQVQLHKVLWGEERGR